MRSPPPSIRLALGSLWNIEPMLAEEKWADVLGGSEAKPALGLREAL